jgi:DNA-binding transcriptional LysR family regulator
MTNNVLDLNRRDADVAIRPARVPDKGLIGKRLCEVDFGIYATPELLRSIDPGSIFGARWIGFVDDLMQSPIGVWFNGTVDSGRICLRCDSFVAVRVAAECGIGLALLPNLLGESSSQLTRLDADMAECDILSRRVNSISLWALAHPDLARSARVHAFIEHLSQALC